MKSKMRRSQSQIVDQVLDAASEEIGSFISNFRGLLAGYLRYYAGGSVSLNQFADVAVHVCNSRGFDKVAMVPSGTIASQLIKRADKNVLEKVGFYDNFTKKLSTGQAVRPPAAMGNGEQFDAIFIGTLAFSEEIKAQLRDQGVPEDKLFDSERLFFERVDYALAESIAEKINRSKKPKLIFPGMKFHNSNSDRLRKLKEVCPNYEIHVLSVSDKVANGPVVDDLDRSFMTTLHVTDLFTQLYVLELLDSKATMVTTGDPFYTPMVLLMNVLFKGRHIHEVYDCVDEVVYVKKFPIYHHHRVMLHLIGKQVWELDHQAKKELSKRVDKLLFRDSHKIKKEYETIYGVKKLTARILPYQSNHGTDLQPKRARKTIRVVHCGHVVPIPRSDNKNLWVDSGVQKSLAHLIPEVVRQKIHFHMYNPSDARGIMRREFAGRIHPEHRNYLHYHKPLYGADFIRKMSNYDFGWMAYDYADYSKRQMPSHHNTVSTKLFSYIQAGLPIIISKEYEHMIEICDGFDMLVVVERGDIPRIGKILSELDMKKLGKEALRARETLDLKNHVGRYIDFITDRSKQSE